MFISFNAALIVEIIKKLIDLNLLLKSANHMKMKRSSNLAMLSIVFLLTLVLCNLFAYGHYIFIGKIPEPIPKLTFLYTFMFYLFCEGFVAPIIVIFSVEHLRTYFLNRVSELATKLINFDGKTYVPTYLSKVIAKFNYFKVVVECVTNWSALKSQCRKKCTSFRSFLRNARVKPMIETI
jgi:hypothetical protein